MAQGRFLSAHCILCKITPILARFAFVLHGHRLYRYIVVLLNPTVAILKFGVSSETVNWRSTGLENTGFTVSLVAEQWFSSASVPFFHDVRPLFAMSETTWRMCSWKQLMDQALRTVKTIFVSVPSQSKKVLDFFRLDSLRRICVETMKHWTRRSTLHCTEVDQALNTSKI